MKDLDHYLPEHLDASEVRVITALALGTHGRLWMRSFRIVSVGQHDEEGTLTGTAENLSSHVLTATGDEDINDDDWAAWTARLDDTLAALGWKLVYPDDLEPGCMTELAPLN